MTKKIDGERRSGMYKCPHCKSLNVIKWCDHCKRWLVKEKNDKRS